MGCSGVRLYQIARQVNLPPKMVLDVAQRLGFDIRNSLSSVSAKQQAAIERAVRRLPPEEPGLSVPSKLRPRGPAPGKAQQELPLSSEEEE